MYIQLSDVSASNSWMYIQLFDYIQLLEFVSDWSKQTWKQFLALCRQQENFAEKKKKKNFLADDSKSQRKMYEN